jgi:hypothetical protein
LTQKTTGNEDVASAEKVQGLGFRFRVQGSGFDEDVANTEKVQGSGFRV